jgi:hypothetical protein
VAFGAGPGNIIIRVGAETASAVRGLNNLSGAMGKTMSRSEKVAAGIKKAAIPAAAAIGVIAVGAKKAIDSASNLNEQINKTGEVFGASSKDVVAWSKTLEKSFGLSQEQALESAGVFGNMLVPMGFARKDAAKMSKAMVQLAGDMASFNNASPEETLDALRSGLAGESEPLRKFGVFLSDARLKQEALRQGLYSGKGALDAHAKAAATMAIIMRDTADAQGDFARTSDSAANQSRIQAAAMEDLQAQLGQALLPAYEAIQKILIKVLGVMQGNTKAIQIMVGIVAALAGGIIAANVALKAYAAAQLVVKAATVAWTAAQWLLNAALAGNPIGITIIAVTALAAAFVVAWKKSETFRDVVRAALAGVQSAVAALGRAFSALQDGAAAAWTWIASHWKLVLFAFGPIGAAVYVISENFDRVRQAGQWAANVIDAAWNVGRFGFAAISNAVLAIARAFERVVQACRDAISAVQELIGYLGRIKIPKLPHIPGLPKVGPAYSYPSARLAGAGATTGAGDVTINVYGAIDPEGTARQIRRLLASHDRRQGRL